MNAISILSLFASFGALFFSFLNYRRGNKFENENHLYKTKVEVYSKILAELHLLLRILEGNVNEIEKYLNGNLKLSAEEVEEKAKKLDALENEFDNMLIKNSLVISSNILDKLDDFSDLLYALIPSNNVKEYDKKQEIAKLNNLIDKMYDLADEINVAFREDLKVEELNGSLYTRLK